VIGNVARMKSIVGGCVLCGLLITLLQPSRASEPGAASVPEQPALGELAVFLGGGPVGGPSTIDQLTLDGKPTGSVKLEGASYGLVHRGDSLVAAVPDRKKGGVPVINADGTVKLLDLKQPFSAPIAIALDPKTQNLLIADNEQNTVSCVLADRPGDVDLLFRAPLEAEEKHFPGMSVAAAADGRVIFSASDPKGVFRMLLWPRTALPDPIVKAEATVAADPTTNRWVAMFQGKLTVFEGTDQTFSIWPPTRTSFWRYRVMAFAPDGNLFLVLQGDQGVEIDSLDLRSRQLQRRFTWKGQEIKCMAVGPKFDWNQAATATGQVE